MNQQKRIYRNWGGGGGGGGGGGAHRALCASSGSAHAWELGYSQAHSKN